jgi:hypothetical protein
MKKIIYVRHNLAEKDVEFFYKNNLIALHYENINSTSPGDYKESSGRNALKRLWSYCNDGVIAATSYSSINPSKLKIGIIKKGEKIKIKKRNGIFYKVVKLHNTKDISFVDYPILAALQPRQGTITGWPSAEKVVKAIYENKSLQKNVFSLSPSQIEVLCYEYLLREGIIDGLLLPIGRSLPHIDIFGISKSKVNIIAQVTFSNNPNVILSKMDLLKTYSAKKTKLIFFGRKDMIISEESVEYISIETVFNSLKKEAFSNYLIERMLDRVKE